MLEAKSIVCYHVREVNDMDSKTTEAQMRAVAKYDAKNTKQYHLKLNLITDADIIERFDNIESIQGYIKQLVREDIARNV